ncbi:MAG: MopE-related protein, partial [Myxococcota bacterium]|nr:MopE-related protein [Myxococcota bacterium]
FDNDCNGLSDDGIDYDHDGWSGCDSEDCNDNNASIYPEAPEVPYDGIDQDCDGVDLTDIDEDGYDGGPYGADCNDNDGDVSPDATEDCEDGIDGDCDGIADGYDDDCVEGDEQEDPSNCECHAAGGPRAAGPLALLAAIGGLAMRRRSRTPRARL